MYNIYDNDSYIIKNLKAIYLKYYGVEGIYKNVEEVSGIPLDTYLTLLMYVIYYFKQDLPLKFFYDNYVNYAKAINKDYIENIGTFEKILLDFRIATYIGVDDGLEEKYIYFSNNIPNIMYPLINQYLMIWGNYI